MSSASLELFITLAVYSLPGLVIGFTLHELMHAVVADRFGDPLPRSQGRISLDPLKQIDPLGFGLLLAIGFGFARPVQINLLRIRSAAQHAFIAFAGPLTNLLLAVVFGLGVQILVHASAGVVQPDTSFFDDIPGTFIPPVGHGGVGYILFYVLYEAMYVNALLFIFNMIPIPPLDGFTVLKGAVGRQIPDVIVWMERNRNILMLVGFLLLFVLPRTGGTNAGGNLITSGVDHIVSAIYGGVAPDFRGIATLLGALSG